MLLHPKRGAFRSIPNQGYHTIGPSVYTVAAGAHAVAALAKIDRRLIQLYVIAQRGDRKISSQPAARKVRKVMTNHDTLSALQAKRAELDAELHQIEQRAEQLRADRAAIDRAIVLMHMPAKPTMIIGSLKDMRVAGGKARARSLTAERRSEIARKAAATRWAKARCDC